MAFPNKLKTIALLNRIAGFLIITTLAACGNGTGSGDLCVYSFTQWLPECKKMAIGGTRAMYCYQVINNARIVRPMSDRDFEITVSRCSVLKDNNSSVSRAWDVEFGSIDPDIIYVSPSKSCINSYDSYGNKLRGNDLYACDYQIAKQIVGF